MVDAQRESATSGGGGPVDGVLVVRFGNSFSKVYNGCGANKTADELFVEMFAFPYGLNEALQEERLGKCKASKGKAWEDGGKEFLKESKQQGFYQSPFVRGICCGDC